MFQITPAAVRELQAALRRSSPDEGGALPPLRIAAREDAQGGLQLGMGLDEAREGDLRLDCDGLMLLLGAPSQRLLDDARLDFRDMAPGQQDFVLVAQAVASGCRADALPAAGHDHGACGRCGAAGGGCGGRAAG